REGSGRPRLARRVPADQHVGRDRHRDALRERRIVVGELQLTDLLAVVDDRRRVRVRRCSHRRAVHEATVLDEGDWGECDSAIVEDRQDSAQHVVGFAAALDDLVDRRERSGAVDHASSASPSKARIASRYEPGMGTAFRSSRSTRTSVCVAVTSIAPSRTRYASSSYVALVRPMRAIRTYTSMRSSNTAGAWYSTASARMTNSCPSSPMSIPSMPRSRRYSTRARSKKGRKRP